MGDIAIPLASHPVLRISVYASRCSWSKIPVQTLMLVVTDLANTKWCKKTKNYSNRGKWVIIWKYSVRVTMNTNKTGFRWFSIILPMLRILSSKAQGLKVFWKPFKPCCVGIHWVVLAEFSQMSTHLAGFQSFFRFFASSYIGQISQQQHKG